MSAQGTDLRSHAATLRRRAGWLIAAAVVGLAAGAAYVRGRAAPAHQYHTGSASDTGSGREQQLRRRHPGAHRPERQHLAAGRRGRGSGPPGREVEKMVEVSAADQPAHPDRRDLDQTRPRRRRCPRPWRTRTSTTSATPLARSRRPPWQTSTTGGRTCRRRSTSCRRRSRRRTKRQQAARPDSPEGREEAQLLAGLRTQQADLALQLDKVEDKIAAGTPVGTLRAPERWSSSRRPAADGTLDRGCGCSSGPPSVRWPAPCWRSLVVLATARRDPRVRLRDDIADAVGSPVLAAMRSRPQRSVAGWSTLLETYQATPVESWALRQVLRGLVPRRADRVARVAGRLDHPQSLTVVSLSGDGRGLAIGPQLAAFASSLGIVDPTGAHRGSRTGAEPVGACATERTAPARPNLFLGNVPDGDDGRPDDLPGRRGAHGIPYLGDTPASGCHDSLRRRRHGQRTGTGPRRRRSGRCRSSHRRDRGRRS